MIDITLYHAVPSRGLIVRWMLEELGVEYHLKLIDLNQDNRSKELQAINPLRQVPCLKHKDQIITESTAICAYLAEAFPKANLAIDSNSPARGNYLKWLVFPQATAEPAFTWQAFGGQNDLQYSPYSDVELVLGTLRQALIGKKFLLENRFTAADIVLGCSIMWGMNIIQALPKDPILTEYWNNLTERPAWRRAQALDQEIIERNCLDTKLSQLSQAKAI